MKKQAAPTDHFRFCFPVQQREQKTDSRATRQYIERNTRNNAGSSHCFTCPTDACAASRTMSVVLEPGDTSLPPSLLSLFFFYYSSDKTTPYYHGTAVIRRYFMSLPGRYRTRDIPCTLILIILHDAAGTNVANVSWKRGYRALLEVLFDSVACDMCSRSDQVWFSSSTPPRGN